MAALLLLAPLLLLGTAAGQQQAEVTACAGLGNATEGNFSVEATPETYQANTTYLVTIKDDRNHSNSSQYLLQALSPQNTSVGTWQVTSPLNCSSVDTAILKITERTANWTSPNSNLSSVQIRVYLSLSGNATEIRTVMLSTADFAVWQDYHVGQWMS
ncbi:chromosome 24 C11orf34 [Turdus rufiventris]|nr:chromosome 24 C11orf34 [Turdus rufiventris]